MPASWLARWRKDAEPTTLGERPEHRLFRLYSLTLGAAYLVVSVVLAGFFFWQMKQDLKAEFDKIRDQVERHGQFLDVVLNASADQVDTLRSAVAYQRTAQACLVGRQQVEQGPVRQSGPHFTWDAVTGGTAGGRLEGEGALAGRSDDFYCDLGAVLALVPQLQAMVLQMSDVGRARFLSVHDFRFETPRRSPSARQASRAISSQAEIWRLAQPGANPGRQRYWGPPQIAGADLGLLAPVAAPVYDGDRFMGVVAVDVRLEFLHRVNTAMGYASGAVAVVDAKGRVLAHHALALPAPEVLAAIPEDQVMDREGWVMIRHSLVSAPWKLVYTVPRTALWQSLLLQRGPALAAALLVLGVLMALIYAVTWRGFVGPAALLAGHALDESNLKPQAAPRVPRVWRPWFESITRVFRESMQLGSLRREVDIAARLQQSILPRQWPEDPRFDLWGTMRPAKDIGGDFYDHFPLPQGRRGLVVADVSGKGISAGLFGMLSKTLLRAIATQRGHGMGEVVREVNEGLCADNESSMFVTTFYGQYDPATGRLVYANAGHPPPLLLKAQGALQWLSGPGGPALGVVPGMAYEEAVVDLSPGDTLLVFTDGVTESINADGQEFGKERLSALSQGLPAVSAREAVQRLLGQVERFAQGVEPFDDITCMALHCRELGPPMQPK